MRNRMSIIQVTGTLLGALAMAFIGRRKGETMKQKILLAAVIYLAVSIIPRYALAQSGPAFHATYYGYGDVIRLTSKAPTELLNLPLAKGEGHLFCVIEATGYVKVETSSATFKVWLEVEEGSQGGQHRNGGQFATDEEVSRRYINSKTGALQASFHTSMVAEFVDCCQEYNVRLLGSNFSGKGSLYVNYHGITATCYDKGYNEVTVLHPGIGISGHVYGYGGRTPFNNIKITGFPDGGVATTDSTGFYSREVPKGWSGVLQACSPTAGPCFQPISRTYNNVTSGVTDQNYTEVLSTVPCPACTQ
jgi:hypothetical protein